VHKYSNAGVTPHTCELACVINVKSSMTWVYRGGSPITIQAWRPCRL